MSLHPVDQTVADISIDFHRLTRTLQPSDSAFLHGLAHYIKDKLVSQEVPSTLDRLIELATRVDLQVQVQRQERRWETLARQHPVHPRGFSNTSAELSHISLSSEELLTLIYCGLAGHYVSGCPVKAEVLLVSQVPPISSSPQRPLVHAWFQVTTSKTSSFTVCHGLLATRSV